MIRVLAKANKKAEILIHETIGQDWYGDGLTSKRFASQLEALGDVSEITVRINSPGGSVSDGIAIYNALRSHPATVKVNVEGLAASIASVIAMAGDEVHMGRGAMMMVHSPWTFAMGDAEDMRKTADVLDKCEESLVGIYAARTGLDADSIKALLKAETWMGGDDAVSQGFADTSDATDDSGEAKARHLATFAKFSKEFRQPADVTPQRIAAALFPSANADSQEMTMIEEEKRAAEAAQKAAQQLAVTNALAAEKSRQDQIRSAFGAFTEDHRDLLDACLSDQAVSASIASEKLLAAVAAKQAGPLGGRVELIADSREKFVAGAVSAIMARMGHAKPEAGNEFSGRSMIDLAEASLRLVNVSTKGLTKDGIARKVLATMTSSDFPSLLSATAGKVLRAGYDAQASTWRAWCAKGSVSDFKIHPRIQMGSFATLDTIPEGSEYKYTGLSEVYENAQALTKGKAIAFTRQMLVNDDLGGFNRRATLMGAAAQRSVNNDIYALLLSGASNRGPNSTDGGQLFNATAVTTAGGHANLTGTGTALSVASLGVGRKMMALQKDPGLKEVLGIQPKVLLTSLTKEDLARTLMVSETDPASNNSKVPNIYKGRFEVVADPALEAANSGLSWYLLAGAADPAALLEVVFLDGVEAPFVDDTIDFETDAMKFKVRMDYGVAIGDWRGGYLNNGAA